MMRVSNVVLLVLAASSTTWANPLRSQLRPKVEEATTSRIVGGELSTPGDYPYFVEMGGCGGALIAPDTVLFAAHCGSWQNKQVSVGAYTRQSVAEGAQDRFCDEWVQDPLYGSGNSGINYDFALCKLNEPVTVDASFVSLELNEADSVPSNGEDLIVMGLGTLSAGGSVPDSVHNVTVPYVPNERCTQSDYYGNQVTDIMLCAGFDAGGKDSCQGDSGGPIVKRTYQGNGRFVDTHVGVVSWGEGCAAPKKPGVYARTSKRADWIKSTTCNQFNSVASFCSNTPSPNPPCGGQDLHIRVKTDNYPQEITTNLRRNSGGVLLTRNYLIKNYQNEHKVCLEENTCYTFTIDDSFGDGIPNGNYELVLNGQVIKSGNGNFGSGTTEDFCTGNSAPNPSPVAQPTNPPQPNPTNPPQPNPTNPPQPSPTNPPQPTPNSGACNGNPERQFQLELRTDFYGFETAWGLYEVQGDDIDEDPVCFGTDYEGDTFYTLPSEDEFYCLELGRCYLFEIYDSYGDGMADPAAGYKGILGGVEIFSGDGIFDNDGFVDEQFFCVGDVGTDGPETFPPTFPETFDPSSTDTVEDSFTGTDPADSDPTASPTASPTPSPTPAPTPSPTPAPTPSPTVSTTSGSSSSTTGCSDNPDFRFKDKANKTCKKFLKGKKKNKLRKKCKKKWKGKQVMDWCAETCGTKVGMGRCDFLQSA